MTMSEEGKRSQATARTREKLVQVALELYGERSIDAVSLRQISAAAGQKNPNALQYHFRDRDGLLQAIIDRHAPMVAKVRAEYVASVRVDAPSPPRLAAQTLILPIVDYIENSPDGANFVKVISQISAVYQNGSSESVNAGIAFPESEELKQVFASALSGLSADDARKRVYLAVTTSFHTLADIYRNGPGGQRVSKARAAMVAQLICLLESYFAADTCQGS